MNYPPPAAIGRLGLWNMIQLIRRLINGLTLWLNGGSAGGPTVGIQAEAGFMGKPDKCEKSPDYAFDRGSGRESRLPCPRCGLKFAIPAAFRCNSGQKQPFVRRKAWREGNKSSRDGNKTSQDDLHASREGKQTSRDDLHASRGGKQRHEITFMHHEKINKRHEMIFTRHGKVRNATR
jgi:hypothetical protein